MKHKSFYTTNDTLNKMKDKATNWEKIIIFYNQQRMSIKNIETASLVVQGYRIHLPVREHGLDP